MVLTKKYRACRVCNTSGNGTHFGVDACRGCTSFFRRTIVHEKSYTCNSDESCNIGGSIEGLPCRKCRFTKCLEVGMRREAVQKNRDVYGKRDQRHAVVSLPPASPTFGLNFPAQSSLMSGIRSSYPQLESVRHVVHNDEGTSLFLERVPRRANYKQVNIINLKEFYLVGDWISNSFPLLSQLPINQKDLLLRNFYLQFFILECGYFACQQGRNDVWFLPNGDFIDCRNLASFYHNPDGEQPMASEVAAAVYSGSCQHYRRNVTTPMLQEKVTQFEFLAMAALVLFDTGLEGQSERSAELCRNVRKVIQRELIEHYQTSRMFKDYPIRMAKIMSILPNLQKATSRMHKDMEINHIFNTFPVEEKFYEHCLRSV